ncbi:MAG: protein-L-isoaspartate(D-aspartate) O-methyltransferase [Anaerolineales bacterium]
MPENEFARARERMVREQLLARDITDRRVLEAMRSVPRHLFVPADLQHLAYRDAPLPIGQRQTISQPYIVALMTQLLALRGDETVLEIGTGSGYQAAVLARLARRLYTMERIPELAAAAAERLQELGADNVAVLARDGSGGLPEHAPYDGVIVTAGAPRVPEPLKEQLSDGGRLVLPVGSQEGQLLELWVRNGADFEREIVAPVAFVPLLGDEGWARDERPESWFG